MRKPITCLLALKDDFLSLIFPNICLCCDRPLIKHEKIICTKCTVELPRSHFHLVKHNPVEKLFWGRVLIVKATSYFIFQKGSRYQTLLHYLKYRGHREIGVELGRRFSAELLQNSFFDDVDFIVPVPLHPKKERKRGYNQSLAIAEGLSVNLMKEVNSTNLFRKLNSDSQTRKGRFERWQNVSTLFDLHNYDLFADKHVLLVDDVVTTGSTLEACAIALQKSNNIKISIATLAFADI